MAEYRNPWQWNNQTVAWDPNAPHQSPWDVTFEQVNPGYISALMYLDNRVRTGQATPAERQEYEAQAAAARAIPMRDPSSLRLGWSDAEVGSWDQGGSDWWQFLNGSSPDLGPIMLTIRDRIDAGTATPQERALFQETIAYDQDWNWRASVPQESDANPFGLGDNLMSALMMLSIGAGGAAAAAPLAAGAGLTLASAGGLLASAGGITTMLAEPLDSNALRMAGLAMGAAGGVTSLASLLSNGLNSVGDVVKAVQRVYGTGQKAMALVNAVQQAGENPAVLAQAQAQVQQSQGRTVGSNSQQLSAADQRTQRSSGSPVYAGGSPTFNEAGGTTMAETTQAQSPLATLLSGLVGGVGNVLSLADVSRYMSQLKDKFKDEQGQTELIDRAYELALARYEMAYARSEQEYTQKQEAYTKALERYDTRYEQQQEVWEKQNAQFERIEGQTDEDRAAQYENWRTNRQKVDESYDRQVQEAREERDYQVARDSANVAKYDWAFNQQVENARQDRATQYQNFDDQYRRHTASQDQRAAQAVEERGLDLNAYQQRQVIGRNLSDPAALKAGAEALYQPLSDLARDRVNVQTEEEMARRGVAGGGQYANLMAAKAFAPQEQQLWSNALNAYLTGQNQALNAYTQQDLTMSPEYRQYQMPTFTQSPGYTAISAPNLADSPGYTPLGQPQFERSAQGSVPTAPGYAEAPNVPEYRAPGSSVPTPRNTYATPYAPFGSNANTGGGPNGAVAGLQGLVTELTRSGLPQQLIKYITGLVGGNNYTDQDFTNVNPWADVSNSTNYGGGDFPGDYAWETTFNDTAPEWYDPWEF